MTSGGKHSDTPEVSLRLTTMTPHLWIFLPSSLNYLAMLVPLSACCGFNRFAGDTPLKPVSDGRFTLDIPKKVFLWDLREAPNTTKTQMAGGCIGWLSHARGRSVTAAIIGRA